jgi:stage V sporulation protein B
LAGEKKNNFMVQGAVLGMSSILVRLIGILYRVPLNNILGEKGAAYYGVAFDVYSILLLLSSYSLPLAVSKMVSARVAVGQFKNTRKVFRYAICFALICATAAFCITFFGADLFAKTLNYPHSALALRVLSPALIILSVLGVLRGFFQGLGTMVPTAFSNIIEQIINAIVSLVAATMLYKTAVSATDAEKAARGAAGGTLGTVIGALAALIFMFVIFVLYRKKLIIRVKTDETVDEIAGRDILRVLVLTIVPVILSTTIYNLSSLIDMGIFSNLMKRRGELSDTIDTLTGMFTGNYRLIVNVPIALASALASSLIPSIVKSMARKSRGQVIRKIDSSIKLTMMIAFPCAVGIGVLAKPIVNLLFPSSVDPGRVALMLMIGCISVVLYSLSTITNSILQGIDKMSVPVKHSAIALASHVGFLVIAMLLTDYNIFCVVVADVIFALIVCFLNHRSIRKYLGYRQEMKKTFILPAVCALIMGAAAFFIYRLLYFLFGSNTVSVLISILTAIIIYGMLLLLFNVIDEEELGMVPKGETLARLAKKLHLMR